MRQLLLVAGLSAAMVLPAAAMPQADYAWRNVAMGGGGAVPGIVLHPRVADLAYIHTDVGGAYRWEAATQSWTPLLESIPAAEWNLYGVDSIAVDPNDASGNTVYLTTGKYTDSWAKPAGMLMKSTDRGATWTRLPLMPTGGSNRDQGCGERLAIDPFNSRHIVYASCLNGLCASLDGGASWTTLATAPRGLAPDIKKPKPHGQGLAFALFDAAAGTSGEPRCSRVLIVGATGDGIYRTRDGGATWMRLEGGPAWPRKGVIGPDGTLLVSHDKGVAKFAQERWTDITPPRKEGGGGCAVAIDPYNAKRFAATLGGGHQTPVFLSSDAGTTWTNVSGARHQTCPWWPGWHWMSNPFSLAFDPHHPGHVWLTDWYGVYHTSEIAAAAPVWENRVVGIEETVAIGALVAPLSGPYRLLSGCADIGGLDHASLTVPPTNSIWSKGLPGGFSRTGIALAPDDPNFVVTVGCRDWNGAGNGAFSRDGGETWQVFASLPTGDVHAGRVGVCGRNHRILWAPQGKPPCYSDDFGKTWRPVACAEDLSGVAHGPKVFVYDQPLAVDAADPDRVYALCGSALFASADAGASFRRIGSGLPDDWAHKLATSGQPGDLWLAAGDKGLHRSTDGGCTFASVAGVTAAHLFCFGKAPAGKTFPALFVQGRVQGEDGYFRSDDAGTNWARIDLPQQRIGDDPNTMAGDWRVFGGVFVGTNGRGIYYGCPAPAR